MSEPDPIYKTKKKGCQHDWRMMDCVALTTYPPQVKRKCLLCGEDDTIALYDSVQNSTYTDAVLIANEYLADLESERRYIIDRLRSIDRKLIRAGKLTKMTIPERTR